MTRLQLVFLIALSLLLAAVVGRVGWAWGLPIVADLAASGLQAAVVAARSVPSWVGWAAIGAAWWLPCAVRAGRCRSACAAPPTS